ITKRTGGKNKMSEYVSVETHFKDTESLVCALAEPGNWPREQIEVHKHAQHLYGYQGDVRPQSAHIIIRRKHSGKAANDIGYERLDNGTYIAHISEYDRNKHGQEWEKDVRRNYAFHCIRIQQER